MSGNTNLKTSVLVAALSLAIVSTAFAGRIIYVDADATGANDGSSWADAFDDLAIAVDAIEGTDVDEVRVAQGVYRPPTWSRTEHFWLLNGVTIKGGYAGYGEPDPNARDIDKYKTILSGDLLGNDREVSDPCDLLDDPFRADNCYHVVSSVGNDATAVLDGFIIRGGNANGPYSRDHDIGGGMRNAHNSNPTLINCTFLENSAEWGGGMYNAGSPVLTECTFRVNSARYGGGMYNVLSFKPPVTLVNCTFIGNTSQWGGGMDNYESDVTLINCTFSGNRATQKRKEEVE